MGSPSKVNLLSTLRELSQLYCELKSDWMELVLQGRITDDVKTVINMVRKDVLRTDRYVKVVAKDVVKMKGYGVMVYSDVINMGGNVEKIKEH